MSDELIKAVFDGDVDAVRRLLDAGDDIDADGRIWNPLHVAIENQNAACVHLLIRRGADIEHSAAGNLSPLAHAVDSAIDGTIQTGGSPGDEPTEIINLLLDAGADSTQALEVAREYESSKIVDLLTSVMKTR
ncbi:MAG TPA: ankyrin repeat domain-containing protein [Blastocatellia bacterium]|nr:ankyrin repeat domain-containing protein [Blastocatellia bacterium]